MKTEKETIGVVGAGAMGAGIAQVAAQAGHHVILIDERETALVRSEEELNRIADRLVSKGTWTAAESQSIRSNVRRTTDWNALKGCAWVIEAIVEQLDIKSGVFQKIEGIVGPDTVLASNTSSLSLTAIAGAMQEPNRFMGLHFFNPAPLMQLVEVIPALQSHPDHIARGVELMKSWGKHPVVAKDTPGFIVNRVARPFYGEALRIVEEGLADCATVDAAMRSAGFRMGPFELMDLIGNDINYAVTCSVFEACYFDPRYRPSLIQKQHVDAGWLGRKSGRGYYDYSKPVQSATADESADSNAIVERIVERIVAMLINEAVEALYLNIATAEDLETAMTKGVNYPKGLLQWANDWGIPRTLEIMERLQQRYGEDRYRPSILLRRKVEEQSRFTW